MNNFLLLPDNSGNQLWFSFIIVARLLLVSFTPFYFIGNIDLTFRKALYSWVKCLTEFKNRREFMQALAMALVTALATKAFEKFGEKTGENISNTATELVKSLFKPDELITLNLSAEHLSQPIEQGKLIGKLEDRLANNSDVANQLQALIDKVNDASSDATITTKRVSEGSDVKSEIETSSAAKGNNEILTEDIERSNITSTIKRN